MQRKFISTILVVILLLSLGITSLAGNVTPRYLFTNYITSTISINGTTATCTSVAEGHIGKTTKIILEQTLQREISEDNWEDVAFWSKTITSHRNSLTNIKTGLISGTYRVKTVSWVYEGDEHFEVITTYSAEASI